MRKMSETKTQTPELTGLEAAKADAAARDAGVLNGVGRKANPVTPPKAPARRTRPATDSNGKVLPARTAKATAKPATAKPAPAKPARTAKPAAKAPAKAETKPATPAEPSKSERKQALAREFVQLVMDHFGPMTDLTPDERERVSYWARCAPTGNGPDGQRFWPKGNLPRPTTAGW